MHRNGIHPDALELAGLLKPTWPKVSARIARSGVPTCEVAEAPLKEKLKTIEAELAWGGASERIGELEALIRDNPLRERLRGQLMLALYRCGRQSEALAVFQDVRRILVDELGLEPGPALRARHDAILRQDPALDATPPVERLGTRLTCFEDPCLRVTMRP